MTRAGLGLLLAAYLLLALHSIYWLRTLTHHSPGEDLQIYTRAVLNAQSGLNPYQPYRVGRSFVYSPFALLLISPFAGHGSVPWAAAALAAWGLSVAMVSWHLRDTACQEARGACALLGLYLAAGLAPLWETVYLGQINALLLLALTGAFVASERGRDLLAGALLAVAVLLKTSPLVLVVYFLAVGRFRVLISCAVSAVLLGALAVVRWGWPVTAQFLEILPRLGNELHPTVYNQSPLAISYVVLRRLGLAEVLGPWLPTLCQGAAAAVAGAGLWAWLRGQRRPTPLARAALYSAALCLMLASSPLVWYHHYTLLLLPLAVLLGATAGTYRRVGWALLFLIQGERLLEQLVSPRAVAMPVALLALLVAVWRLSWQAGREAGRVDGGGVRV